MISQFDQWTTPGGCDHYRWMFCWGIIIWIFYGRHSRYSLSYMKRQMQSMLKVRNAPWSLFLLGLFQELQRCLYDKLEAVLANGMSMATQLKCMTSRIDYLKTSLLLNGLILIPISSSSRISRKIFKQRLSMN